MRWSSLWRPFAKFRVCQQAIQNRSSCQKRILYETFDFVFFTDTHLQPELSAVAGCAKCFNQINESKPEFCISGGDQVFDVCEQYLRRAHMLFHRYRQTETELG